ncbi:MAG: hypothetical protein Wins2KO_12890 [Winogradskyella sp.]
MKKLSFLAIFYCLIINAQVDFNSKIETILDTEYNNIKNSPGINLIVVKNSRRIFYGARGLANLEYDIKFNDSTSFDIASLTKQFTSSCIGILENDSLLSVEDDIRKFIPEMRFYGDTIKIKHLLNHTSGIRNHNILLDLKGFDFKHSGYNNKIIQDLMFSQKGVNNKPGERILYSNTNYVLLALIIERVSGLKINEFARKNIFEPLGMNNTRFLTDLDDVVKNKAYEYYMDNGVYKNPKTLTLCLGAGGMLSTLHDLAKWSEVFTTNKYPVLNSFITKRDNLDSEIARGVFVSPYKEYTTINHGGRGFGMRAYFISVPKIELSIIIYANLNNINVESIAYKILDLFLPVDKRNNSKIVNHNKKVMPNITEHIGTYQELNSDLTMDFSVINDTLRVKNIKGRTMTSLVPINTNKYTRKDNESIIYNFKNNHNCDLTINFGGGLFYFKKIKLIDPKEVNINDYIGTYRSIELGLDYSIKNVDGKLILSYENNYDIDLTPIQKNVFGSGRRIKYEFKWSESKKIEGLNVSAEGTVKNIYFKKI